MISLQLKILLRPVDLFEVTQARCSTILLLQLIDFWPGWQAWRSVHFLGHILIFVIMGVGTLFPPPHKPKPSGPAAADKAIPGVNGKAE